MSRSILFQKYGDVCQCLICPHLCRLRIDEKGICGVRQNINGSLVSINYAQISALALDPIEKKPLYHYYPGEKILSVGSVGCNFKCGFCQNWSLAKAETEVMSIDIEQLIDTAKKQKSLGIAFTYSEPLMWYEYLRDTLPLTKEAGLKNVIVTNGFICQEPLQDLLPYIDAVNLDIKSFSERTYKKFFNGNLQTVLDNAVEFKKNCHLEITTLIVPGVNDSLAEVLSLAKWLADKLGKDTPYHISRYYPAHRFTAESTSLDLLQKMFTEVKKILPYVYLGNIQGDANTETRCPSCGGVVIKRHGVIRVFLNEEDKCPFCGQHIYIKNEEE